MSKEIKTLTKQSNQVYFSNEVWNSMSKMAETFIQAQALPKGIDNVPKVMMVLQAGYECGMKPIEALNSFYFVSGKLSIYGKGQIAQVIRAGYEVEWGECNEITATVTISRKDRKSHTETYTMQQAIKAGLPSRNQYVWKPYPENMLKFKAFGNCARFYCPEALDGFYSKEELEAGGNEQMRVIQGEIVNGNGKLITSEQEITIKVYLEKKGKEMSKMLEHYKVKTLKEMDFDTANKVITMLEQAPDKVIEVMDDDEKEIKERIDKEIDDSGVSEDEIPGGIVKAKNTKQGKKENEKRNIVTKKLNAYKKICDKNENLRSEEETKFLIDCDTKKFKKLADYPQVFGTDKK